MSQENVEIVRRWYRHWNDDEVEQLVSMLSPDFVYTPSGVFPDFDAVYRGRDGFVRFRQTQVEAFEYFRIEVREIGDLGDWVMVDLRLVGKGRGSGVDVDLDFHHAWRVRDGLLDRLSPRRTRAEALEAVGLSE
jgi:ketosteroid isomerase-like protein